MGPEDPFLFLLQVWGVPGEPLIRPSGTLAEWSALELHAGNSGRGAPCWVMQGPPGSCVRVGQEG